MCRKGHQSKTMTWHLYRIPPRGLSWEMWLDITWWLKYLAWAWHIQQLSTSIGEQHTQLGLSYGLELKNVKQVTKISYSFVCTHLFFARVKYSSHEYKRRLLTVLSCVYTRSTTLIFTLIYLRSYVFRIFRLNFDIIRFFTFSLF